MLTKKFLATALIAGVVGISLFAYYKFSTADKSADSKIELLRKQKNLNGFQVKASLFDKPYIIVNFWATWCPPCIEETPSLIKFVQENRDFSLIALSQDDSMNEINNFLKLFPNSNDVSIEVVFDQTKEVSRLYGVNKLPESFVYSFKSKKVLQISGATDWSAPEMREKILKVIEN